MLVVTKANNDWLKKTKSEIDTENSKDDVNLGKKDK